MGVLEGASCSDRNWDLPATTVGSAGIMLKDNLRCPFCQKTYSRREHLQRHLTLHGNERPFICDRCQRQFNRKDVLKRHLTICRAANDIYLGSLKHANSSAVSDLCQACNRCQRHQLICSFDQPCSSCLATNETCVYSWRSSGSYNADHNELFARSEGDMTIDRQIFDRLSSRTYVSCTDQRPKVTFEFLINFTTDTGFATTFDNDLSFHRQRAGLEWWYSELDASNLDYSSDAHTRQDSPTCVPVAHESEMPRMRRTHVFGYPVLMNEFDVEDKIVSVKAQHIAPMFTEQWLSNQQYDRPSTSSTWETEGIAHELLWDYDPLTCKAVEIVSRIKEATICKPRNSAFDFQWSATVEKTCLHFFSPPNLRKFVSLYWISWYPHWPVIHKPTFVAAATPCTLLVAMVLIGASYSPDTADHEQSRTWLNAAEEMVFGDEYFCDDIVLIVVPPSQSVTVPCRRFQALQAAHAMCLCQTFEGDDASKRRARHHRFNAVVALARSFGFTEGKHENLCNILEHDFSWPAFIAREETIRTLDYVFLLDSGFVIFYNLPPKLVIQEAQTSLVCPEACFQAPTAADCLNCIRTWTSRELYRPNISLSSAIEILCRRDITYFAQGFFLEVGSVNLLILAAVFNSIAFHFRPTLGHGTKLVPLQYAISHWGNIWTSLPPLGKRTAFGTASPEMVSFTKQDEMWKRLGFMKHAHEFWLLSRIIVDQLALSQGHSVDFDKTRHLGSRLADLEAYVLNKYNQATMDQLRTAILAVAKSAIILNI